MLRSVKFLQLNDQNNLIIKMKPYLTLDRVLFFVSKKLLVRGFFPDQLRHQEPNLKLKRTTLTNLKKILKRKMNDL